MMTSTRPTSPPRPRSIGAGCGILEPRRSPPSPRPPGAANDLWDQWLPVGVRRLVAEGPRVLRTGMCPINSCGESQFFEFGVHFARGTVTHCRMKPLEIVPEFYVPSDVPPGLLAGGVTHA